MDDSSELPKSPPAENFRALAYIYIWRNEPTFATRETAQPEIPFSKEKWHLLTAYTN